MTNQSDRAAVDDPVAADEPRGFATLYALGFKRDEDYFVKDEYGECEEVIHFDTVAALTTQAPAEPASRHVPIMSLRECLEAEEPRAAALAPAEPAGLTDEQISRHRLLAGDCPPQSEVLLASSVRRLLAKGSSDATPPNLDGTSSGTSASLGSLGAVSAVWLATKLWNTRETWTCPADIEKLLAAPAPVEPAPAALEQRTGMYRLQEAWEDAAATGGEWLCIRFNTFEARQAAWHAIHDANIDRPQAVEPGNPANQAKDEGPEFTDSARNALLWVLWHHQGGSSPVGQPIRFALGIGQHDRMTADQVERAKRWGDQEKGGGQ